MRVVARCERCTVAILVSAIGLGEPAQPDIEAAGWCRSPWSRYGYICPDCQDALEAELAAAYPAAYYGAEGR